MNEDQSKVRIQVADILDCQISDLKVEVRDKGRVVFRGKTCALGSIDFFGPKQRDLVIYVENWLTAEMKAVANFFTGKDNIDLKLVSPKYKTKITTKPSGSPGNYVRGTYTVKAGDTLSSIAKSYGVSSDYLARINKLSNPDKLSVGQIIKVPPVAARTKNSQPHKAATATPPHSAGALAHTSAAQTNGIPPLLQNTSNSNGHHVAIVTAPQPAVIFPLVKKPLNEPGGLYPSKNWTLGTPANAACFSRPRGGGRLHAGRDLYTEDLTGVVSVAPGKVLHVSAFYMKTSAISIHHTTSDGRNFIVRYGEVDPETIQVKEGDEVLQGQLIGKTGILLMSNGSRLIAFDNVSVSMLHFELYTGAAGLNNVNNLSNTSLPYKRRADLIDPLSLLQEGYLNSFREGTPPSENDEKQRLPISKLSLSTLGSDFIKNYEKLRLDHYEDSFGYCTVGWGHLTGGKKSCASQGIELGRLITEDYAKMLFKRDAEDVINVVVRAIKVPLYQHEFDALVSLAFNVGDIGKVAPALCKAINEKRYTEAANEFLDITNGGVKGLVKRRKQENAMFLSANYDSTH